MQSLTLQQKASFLEIMKVNMFINSNIQRCLSKKHLFEIIIFYNATFSFFKMFYGTHELLAQILNYYFFVFILFKIFEFFFVRKYTFFQKIKF